MTTSNTGVWPIEKRCQRHDTNAFVTAATVDLLAEKLVGIVGERRTVKMHRYLGDGRSTPTVTPGLRLDYQGLGGPVSRQPGMAVGIRLTSRARAFEGVSFGVWQDDETEEAVAARYHHPDEEWLGQRRNITFVQLDGWPGSPSRDDRIRIEYWNDSGVGQETILVFDDVDPVEEIAWDVKGDRERQVHLWDEFCDLHGFHYEHPDHERSGKCDPRWATLAETLTVLAYLAQRAETGAQKS